VLRHLRGDLPGEKLECEARAASGLQGVDQVAVVDTEAGADRDDVLGVLEVRQ
jgi:hypothetical protein